MPEETLLGSVKLTGMNGEIRDREKVMRGTEPNPLPKVLKTEAASKGMDAKALSLAEVARPKGESETRTSEDAEFRFGARSPHT